MLRLHGSLVSRALDERAKGDLPAHVIDNYSNAKAMVRRLENMLEESGLSTALFVNQYLELDEILMLNAE